MFEDLNNIVNSFNNTIDDLKDDMQKRLEQNKRIDELLGNYKSVSNEETTKYQVMGDK